MMGNEFGSKSYEYAVGCIKATSHPPLSAEQIRRLSDAESGDFEKLLDEFGWGKGIVGSLHERIEGEMQYAISFIKDISPNKALTDLLFFEEDASNLKLFLKGRLINKDVTYMANKGGSIPLEILRGSVEAWDFSLISEEVDDELKPYENEKNPFVISSIGDRAIFLHTLEKAKKSNTSLYEMLLKYGEAKNRIAQARYIQINGEDADIKNILLPVSCEKVEADASKAPEIIADANESISKAMYELRSGENFAPIAEYFFAKKEECATLRKILAGLNLKGKDDRI